MVLFFFVLQIALFLTLCQFWQFYNLNVNFDKNKNQSVEKGALIQYKWKKKTIFFFVNFGFCSFYYYIFLIEPCNCIPVMATSNAMEK